MGKEQILDIIKKMRREGTRTDVILSAFINSKLRADEMEEVYELLEKNNLLIILRSVIKQHERIGKIKNLNMPLFREIVTRKGLEKEMLVELFEKCIELKRVRIFCEVCDIIKF